MPSGEGGNRLIYTCAAALQGRLSTAEWLLADRGIYADWSRYPLKDKGIKLFIPGSKSPGKLLKREKRRDKPRNRVEIMFGRLKHLHRSATRNDKCAKPCLSAVALASTVKFWRCE